MTAKNIWDEFSIKLLRDIFAETDFHLDMRPFLSSFLSGVQNELRRKKFINSPAKFYDCETKKCVVLHCPDDKYRFDFEENNGTWQLCFIEGITLPVDTVAPIPYENFTPLSEQEGWIRTEREISKTVYFYCKLKKLYGVDEALSWFNDGAGELLCAKSWVPFYNDSKAFVIFSAWIEECIHGEHISVIAFTDTECKIRFKKHLWFKVYHAASHIKTQLSLDEYTNLFEHVWTDRAHHAGWKIDFTYLNEDTVLLFTKEDVI